MSSVIVTRVVSAPASVVWETFADLRARASWLSEVESVELLTPGPFALGTRWRETRRTGGGSSVTEELVITAVEPGRSCTMTLVGSGTANHLTYVFASIDVGPHRGGTAVTAEAEAHTQGLANRFLAFVLGGFAARTAEGALRDELDALAAASRARGSAGPAAA